MTAEFIQRFPDNVRSLISTVILGLVAGLSAVAFLFSINLFFAKTYLSFATRSPTYFVVASFLVITSTSLAVGLLLNVVSPEAAGSGIPQLKAAYWQELGFVKLRSVVTKFIAGVLSIGGGNSLGREGPSVFIGGGVASTVDGLMGTPQKNRRGAAVIGAAAGLAAAFNTPLAAITFVIEEIIGDLNDRHLGRVVLAAVMGAFVVYALLGKQPAFLLPPVAEVSWWHYFVVPIVALCAALAGVVFQRIALAWRGRLKRQKAVPAWSMPIAGGLITWGLGVSVFLTTGHIGVFGLGYQDLSAALRNDLGWQVAGILVLAKLFATIAGYSLGGCGGIFAPSLFIGGLTGYFLGGLARGWIPLTPADQIVLAAVGMSACLGAIIRAPLTSMLMVFEMTHQFAFVPGLMLGMIVSQAIARLAGRLNFYDALLVQDGHELHKIRPPLDMHGWRELPVSAIATPRLTTLGLFTEESMRQVMERTPYQSYPVIRNGRLLGVVTRRQLKQALLCQEPPPIGPVGTCFPDQTIGEIGNKFLNSTANVLMVVDRGSGAAVGLITLHDLIRAQAAVQQ